MLHQSDLIHRVQRLCPFLKPSHRPRHILHDPYSLQRWIVPGSERCVQQLPALVDCNAYIVIVRLSRKPPVNVEREDHLGHRSWQVADDLVQEGVQKPSQRACTCATSGPGNAVPGAASQVHGPLLLVLDKLRNRCVRAL